MFYTYVYLQRAIVVYLMIMVASTSQYRVDHRTEVILLERFLSITNP